MRPSERSASEDQEASRYGSPTRGAPATSGRYPKVVCLCTALEENCNTSNPQKGPGKQVQVRFRETAHTDLTGRNAVALEAVQRQKPVYDAPKLAKGYGGRTTQGKRAPDAEHKRRAGIRWVNEELSRYYETLERQGWRCPELLAKGKHDHNHSASRNSAYLYPFLVLKEV